MGSTACLPAPRAGYDLLLLQRSLLPRRRLAPIDHVNEATHTTASGRMSPTARGTTEG